MELDDIKTTEKEQNILLELASYLQKHPDSDGMDIVLLGQRIQGIRYLAIRSDILGLQSKKLVFWNMKPRGNNKVIFTKLGESYFNKYLAKKLARKNTRFVDYLELKPNFHGIGFDLKKLFRKE